jgi:hypothetical protein
MAAQSSSADTDELADETWRSAARRWRPCATRNVRRGGREHEIAPPRTAPPGTATRGVTPSHPAAERHRRARWPEAADVVPATHGDASVRGRASSRASVEGDVGPRRDGVDQAFASAGSTPAWNRLELLPLLFRAQPAPALRCSSFSQFHRRTETHSRRHRARRRQGPRAGSRSSC